MDSRRDRPRPACSPSHPGVAPVLSSTSSAAPSVPDLAAEQTAVTDLYRRLDAARELAVTRFRQGLALPVINPQALGERGGAARFQGQRITALDAADHGLVIGRLDRESSPQPLYIGRVGLAAADPAGDPALGDWGGGARRRRIRHWWTGGRRRRGRSTRRRRSGPRASSAAGTSAPAGGRSPRSTTRC